jgi:hypothetical protein
MTGLDSLFSRLGLKPIPEISLFEAISRGNLEKVKKILEEKPNKNATYGDFYDGQRNRFVLASPKQTRLMRQGKRVYLNGRGQPGSLVSPAQFARNCGSERSSTISKEVAQAMVDVLVMYGFPRPRLNLYLELNKAVLANDASAVESLIKRGADPDNNTHRPDLPIIAAMQKGYFSIVRLLVEGGADINVRSLETTDKVWVQFEDYSYGDDVTGYEKTVVSGGCTPLMIALENHNWELAMYLLDKGADINAEDVKKETALMKAQRNGAPDTLIQRLLLGRPQ